MEQMKFRIPRPLRARLQRIRRTCFEAVGSGRYSHPALNAIDRKLERYLDFDCGFFVEAGANDGVTQSNTYYFEKVRKWRGLLVEPIPALAAACAKNRRAPVVQAALVSDSFTDPTVELEFAGLMSTTRGAFGDADEAKRHVERGLQVQNLNAGYTVKAQARTLSSILDEFEINCSVDLLSLDVEGAEIGALQGLDFSRHAPRFICVETRQREAVEQVLSPRYRVVEVLTHLRAHQDLLFQLV